ncbi:Dolichyl-phosphate-mannose-protein mannosyltransferase-domain-containing protein [Entophlyctis helioformis]|nr:Dolichyl-phosphate-mannose-protein mannosyltransferase-domain-containing protein [Entophlyctis helioformis]
MHSSPKSAFQPRSVSNAMPSLDARKRSTASNANSAYGSGTPVAVATPPLRAAGVPPPTQGSPYAKGSPKAKYAVPPASAASVGGAAGPSTPSGSPKRTTPRSGSELPSPYDKEPKQTFFAYSHRRGPQNVNMAVVLLITLATLAVRLYNISHPHEVVFDEVHFGGFASKYIQSKFFMDVHPPLGKLIVTASGVVSGFNGSFTFKEIGLDYNNASVPYVPMRGVSAIFGVMLSPIAYTTMRNFGFSSAAAILTAVLVTVENAFVCQFRLILLDSFLLFFTALTAMLWSEFRRAYDRPFSTIWWRTLTFTGIGLGLTLSVKWVGLFTVALIGVFTLMDLWQLLTDSAIPLTKFARHFFARAVCLIAVPLAIYLFFFQIHFSLLTKETPSTGYMSPEFQSTFKGKQIENTYADVAYGSMIALRHEATRGGYLHSHPSNYPAGSKQQQMTCYPYRDTNSWFSVKLPLVVKDGSTIDPPTEGFQLITHGSTIRLEHNATAKRIHSHDVRPSWNEDKDINEVSGYGEKGHPGDTNDHWVVELVDEKDGSTANVKAIHSRIRLRHANLGCYLYSRAQKLPEWGFSQQEVTCSRLALKKLTVWRIEYNQHDNMPADAKKVNYKAPGFLSKVIELHQVMWRINANLKGTHAFSSRPETWPILKRGISFWRAKKAGDAKTFIYLLGNPLIWWSALAAVVVYAGYEILAAIATRRGIVFVNQGFLKEATNACWFFFTGWGLHYLPFFVMGRQLFLHHYLPSLYFSILLLGGMFDVLTLKLRTPGQILAALAVAGAAIYVFVLFAPIAYGLPMDKEYCESLRWRSSWDLSCNGLPSSSATTAAIAKTVAPSLNPDT